MAISIMVAVFGVGLGFLSGNFIKENQASLPTTAQSQTVTSKTYSGKVFPIEVGLSSNYSYKLVDTDGNTTAYLKASDDKLKIVLAGTEVSIKGAVEKMEGVIPVIKVDSLSF